MRIILCLLFTLSGLAFALIFAVGLIPVEGAKALGIPTTSLEALSDPTFGIGAIVSAVAAFFFLGYAFRSGWSIEPSSSPSGERSWGQVCQLGFSASVALVGAFLLAILLSASGLSPIPSASGVTLGALLLLATLQAGVGTALAVVLLFVRNLDVHYVGTVTVHVMEVALLSVVFLLGTSA